MILDSKLTADTKAPALCHTVIWDGTLSEGMDIKLNSAIAQGCPALFVGNTYVRVDGINGALFHKTSVQDAIVRRATLKEIPNGQYSMYFLTGAVGDDHPVMVHVDLNLPKQVKLKHEFWFGVQTQGRVLVKERREQLLLLKKGEHALIFCADGSVVKILHTKKGLKTESLRPERQATLRIERANDALSMTQDSRVRDTTYHEIISILEISRKFSDTIPAGIIRSFIPVVKATGFSRTVWQRLRPHIPFEQRGSHYDTAIAAAFEAAKRKMG